MRTPRPLLCALLALLAGCDRKFDAAPALKAPPALAVDPPLLSAAPRQAVPVAVRGGTPPYTLGFAADGQRSGAGAAFAALEDGGALYVAGAQGSAQDVLRVADSAGQEALVRASVGARMQVAPAAGRVAPGGGLTLVASGGLSPATFAARDGGCGGSEPPGGSGFTITPEGHYRAGPLGGVRDCVEVHDGTGDPAADPAPVTVEVGPALKLYALAAQVGPGAGAAFLAVDGQPPYHYRMADGGDPSGGTVDASTGRYTAGPRSDGGTEPVLDTVEVVDTNGQQAQASIAVAPPLSAALEHGDLHPGDAVRIQASGGAPPYRLHFAPKGNHSKGQVDAPGLTYTVGPNVGAHDTLRVTDSTGAWADLALDGVGPLRVGVGHAFTCTAADVDGDGKRDLIEVAPYGSEFCGNVGTLEVVLRPGFLRQRVETVCAPGLLQAVAGDWNGDGLADLAWLTKSELLISTTLPDGSMGSATVAATSPLGSSLPGGGGLLGAGLAMAKADGGATSFFFGARPHPLCANSLGQPRRGVWRVDWPDRGNAPLAPRCAAIVTSFSGESGLAAGDWNGDGEPDVAWVTAELDDGGYALRWAYGPDYAADDAGSFPVAYLPEGSSYQPAVDGHSSLATVPGAGGQPDRVALLLVQATDAGSQTAFALADLSGAGQVGPTAPTDRLGGRAAERVGLAPADVDGPAWLMAWDGLDGLVQLFAADPDAGALGLAPLPRQPDTFPIEVDCAVGADVNGDQARDLTVTAGNEPFSEVAYGDGALGFGGGRRFAAFGGGPLRDVDGDGLPDQVLLSSDYYLTVLFRAGQELAYGEGQGPFPSALDYSLGDYAGDGGTAVLYHTVDDRFLVLPLDATGQVVEPLELQATLQPGPLSNPFLMFTAPAHLGPGGAGFFLSLSEFDASGWSRWAVAAGSRQGPDGVQLRSSAPMPMTCGQFLYQALDLDRDGLDDVVAACAGPTDLAFYSARAEVDGGLAQLSPWATDLDLPNFPWGVGGLGVAGQRAYFSAVFSYPDGGVLSDGGLPGAVVVVGPAGASVVDLPGINLRMCVGVACGRVGHVDGDPYPDVVLSDRLGTAYLLRGLPDGGLAAPQAFSAPGRIEALVPEADGGLDDLFLGIGEDVLERLNDGQGRFP